MGGEGFEPSKALLADLQSAPFGHSGTRPDQYEIFISCLDWGVNSEIQNFIFEDYFILIVISKR